MTVAITCWRPSCGTTRRGRGMARLPGGLLAIALVLEGWSRQDAAATCAMDGQTLRDWVHRYNVEVCILSDRQKELASWDQAA